MPFFAGNRRIFDRGLIEIDGIPWIAPATGYSLAANKGTFSLVGQSTLFVPADVNQLFGSRLKRDYGGALSASQWTDQAIGAHATQGTSIRQPAATTTTLGRPGLNFVADSGGGDDPDSMTATASGTSESPARTLIWGCFRCTAPSPDPSGGIAVSMGDSNRFYIYFSDDGILHAQSFNDSAQADSDAALDDDQWHRFIAYINDTGSNVKLYVDGVLQAVEGNGSGSSTINLGAQSLYIGTNLGGTGLPYVGRLAKVGIAQSASTFSNQEITDLDDILRYWIEGDAAAGILADTGSFALTGFSSGLTAQRKVVAEQGAFVETGNALGLAAQRKTVADVGAFALTGQVAGLLSQRRIAADRGIFALTGNEATLSHGIRLVSDGGVFVLDGQVAGLVAQRKVVADRGIFSLVRIDAGLFAHRILSVQSSSFSLVGNAINLQRGFFVAAAPGAFVLDGLATSLRVDRWLTGSTGSFAVNGIAANPTAQRKIFADTGTFALIGNDANLVYAPIGSYTIVASVGTFDLAGQPAGLLASHKIVAASGALTLTGQTANLRRALKLSADLGSFSVVGNDAGLWAQRRLFAALGALSFTGNTAALLRGTKLIATIGNFVLTGQNVELRAQRRLVVEQGIFSIVGNAADLVRGRGLQASTGSFALIGNAAALIATRILLAEPSVFTLAGIDVELIAVQAEGELTWSYRPHALLLVGYQRHTDLVVVEEANACLLSSYLRATFLESRMTIRDLHVGDDNDIDLVVKVRDVNGIPQLTDPGAVSIKVTTPSGVETTYIYGTHPELTKIAVGRYRATIACTEASTPTETWRFEWVTTSPAKGREPGYFDVGA